MQRSERLLLDFEVLDARTVLGDNLRHLVGPGLPVRERDERLSHFHLRLATRQDERARVGGLTGFACRDPDDVNRLLNDGFSRDSDKRAVFEQGCVQRGRRVRLEVGVAGEVTFHFGEVLGQGPNQFARRRSEP